MDGNTDIAYVQARYYTRGRSGGIRGATIHDMEAPEKGGTAESTAHYFQVITHPASAHYNCDNDSIVQSVRDGDTAYHAPGVNHCHLGFEHAGYARQSAVDWHDPYSWAMLQRSAALLAKKAQQYGFPIVFIDRNDLKAGRLDGVTTHNEVTLAFHKSTHTDPGPGFPMTEYLAMARDGAHTVPPPKTELILQFGDHGPAVEFLQAMETILAPVRINSEGHHGGGRITDPKGQFGASTREATREVQRFGLAMAKAAKLPQSQWTKVDGIAGPKTAEIIAYWVPQVLKAKK